MEGEYYMEHGSVAHRGEELNIISAKLALIFFSQIFPLISFYYFGSVENIEEHRDIFKIVPPTIKISSSNINSTDGAFRLPTTCDNPLVRPTYSSE